MAPPLASGRALIEAVTAMGEPAPAVAPTAFGERVGGVAEAFARLEQARRIERGWAR